MKGNPMAKFIINENLKQMNQAYEIEADTYQEEKARTVFYKDGKEVFAMNTDACITIRRQES